MDVTDSSTALEVIRSVIKKRPGENIDEESVYLVARNELDRKDMPLQPEELPGQIFELARSNGQSLKFWLKPRESWESLSPASFRTMGSVDIADDTDNEFKELRFTCDVSFLWFCDYFY